MREKRHLAFTRDEIDAIAQTLGQLGTLIPVRRGDQAEWSDWRKGRYSRDNPILAAESEDPAHAYGLILDALEGSFSPNFKTSTFLRLARFIEDPDSTDPYWTHLFRQRRMRPSVSQQELSVPYGPDTNPLYDELLNTTLVKRGWHAQTIEDLDPPTHKYWRYGPVNQIRHMPLYLSVDMEEALTTIYCRGVETYEVVGDFGPRQTIHSRDGLLRAIHFIEEYSWVPTWLIDDQE